MKTKAGLHGAMIVALMLATVGIALACMGCRDNKIFDKIVNNDSLNTDNHQTVNNNYNTTNEVAQ